MAQKGFGIWLRTLFGFGHDGRADMGDAAEKRLMRQPDVKAYLREATARNKVNPRRFLVITQPEEWYGEKYYRIEMGFAVNDDPFSSGTIDAERVYRVSQADLSIYRQDGPGDNFTLIKGPKTRPFD